MPSVNQSGFKGLNQTCPVTAICFQGTECIVSTAWLKLWYLRRLPKNDGTIFDKHFTCHAYLKSSYTSMCVLKDSKGLKFHEIAIVCLQGIPPCMCMLLCMLCVGVNTCYDVSYKVCVKPASASNMSRTSNVEGKCNITIILC